MKKQLLNRYDFEKDVDKFLKNYSADRLFAQLYATDIDGNVVTFDLTIEYNSVDVFIRITRQVIIEWLIRLLFFYGHPFLKRYTYVNTKN